jgi:hypothetical protein
VGQCEADDAEGNQLAAAFRRSGVDAAIQELKRHPSAGQLRSISGLIRTIRYAQEIRSTGGAPYVLLLLDPFTSQDLFRAATASGGDLAVVTIWLGLTGTGEGQIAAGTQIGIDAFGAITVDVRESFIVLPTVSRQTQ